ncbi:MAG: aminodeoxychorismate lyase [Thermomonas hydrothermalis]|uniref:aminodeoxychorismate lyase n=1 Tax=Thermomonas hydrothermalis TaxID=213588 RepID=UPI0023544C13|nr:aminodeoxychorismate lyase [Thermomonas hydrothermalis]MCL6619853.1 aminodeoxychorismate lyase [Thermomonas hydrothermalis]
MAMVKPLAALSFQGHTRLRALSLANRGLNYGDGLFETMRIHRGDVPLWSRHLARLREGAERLGMTLPEQAFIEAQIAAISADVEAGVLKLLLTRGDGGRGYLPPAAAVPVWALTLHPLPARMQALRLHPCRIRMAIQPALAGIKHCNRLEQVLARVEVAQAGCDEGLLCDASGAPVCATAANLLVLCDGHWLTPPVDRCGVAGVLRGWLLEAGLVRQAALSLQDVTAAEALALCNAVRGILPVAALGERHWSFHPALTTLHAALARAYPMFDEAAA